MNKTITIIFSSTYDQDKIEETLYLLGYGFDEQDDTFKKELTNGRDNEEDFRSDDDEQISKIIKYYNI